MTVVDEVSIASSPPRAGVVRATINYVAPMEARPLFHAQDHRRDNLVYDPHTVTIHDARRFDRLPSLDIEGVVLHRHTTKVTDFRDHEQVQDVYLPTGAPGRESIEARAYAVFDG